MLHHYVRPEGIQPPDPGISGVGAGLLKQCPYCKEAREALASINKVLAKVALRATRHEDEDIDTLQPPRITVLGPFKVECGSCKGRGLVLTGYGGACWPW